MAMLLGKKIGMTRVYDEDGKMTSVTVIEDGPGTVTQIKTSETVGYCAVQLGYDDVKASRIKKPALGHAAKAGTTPKRFVREMRLGDNEQSSLNPGDQVGVDTFEGVKFVDIIGTSKGKGYAGAMKRHGFGGFPASHGCERKHRAPGSLSGHGSDRGHGGNVKKGKRMAGHMGFERVTSKHHKLMTIDAEKNLIVVKGAVPGPAGSYIEIRTSKTRPQA